MSQVKAFPAMPATAVKLLPLLRDPEPSASQIEDILKLDPGLTANLLKLTNSAYFGLPSRVSSVRQAVAFLGWDRLLKIVMTMCMSAVMKNPVPGYDLPRGELWRHSVAVGVAAGHLADALAVSGADEIFTAALLHDIGKLVLGGFVQGELQKIEQLVEKGISFEVAEFVVLGTNHAEVGARILRGWALPRGLVDAVSWHHDPDRCGGSCLPSDVVHIANVLGLRAGFGKGLNGQEIEPAPEVLDRLGLGQEALDEISRQTLQEMSKLSDLLG
jgi:putative nucleotidyltransferase with HDIG domain